MKSELGKQFATVLNADSLIQIADWSDRSAEALRQSIALDLPRIDRAMMDDRAKFKLLSAAIRSALDGESPTGLAVVCGRTIDGADYLSAMGWTDDFDSALVFSTVDAETISEREREREEKRANRCPDSGRYQIKAIAWRGPRLSTLADYEQNEQESADFAAQYGESN